MTPPQISGPEDSYRLNRFLALAGHGSRRSVEALIQAGRVAVDGQIVSDLGCRVDPRRQRITIDGQDVRLARDQRVYAFHKPLDVVCTLRAQGDQTGLLAFRREGGLPDRFQPIGRLDRDSSGLLLWTDDGRLAQALLRPRQGVWKTYQVTLTRPLKLSQERILAKGGLVLDGRPLLPCRVVADPQGDRRVWQIQLQEGRNRQIRRMIAALGNRVLALRRIAIGPITIGRLRPGGFRRLTAREVAALRQAAGLPGTAAAPGES